MGKCDISKLVFYFLQSDRFMTLTSKYIKFTFSLATPFFYSIFYSCAKWLLLGTLHCPAPGKLSLSFSQRSWQVMFTSLPAWDELLILLTPTCWIGMRSISSHIPLCMLFILLGCVAICMFPKPIRRGSINHSGPAAAFNMSVVSSSLSYIQQFHIISV